MSFVYRGLEGTLDRHIVTDLEVKRQLEYIIQQNPKVQVITDRPAQLGDELILDYAGFCDGVQFEGGTAEYQSLTLGSGRFIPGFEEQLVGANAGSFVTVNVTFPEAYHAPNLAGKAAEFRCKIHEVRVSTNYELDDVFAREIGGCETLEAFRTKLHSSMQAYSDDRSEMELQQELMRKAAATVEINPTEEEMEQALEEQMNNLTAQLAQKGLTLEMYCRFTNSTPEKLREDARANAQMSIQMNAAVDQIVALENLTASEEEINQAVALVARQNNMTLEELKPYYDAEFEAAIVRSVLGSKAMKVIRDSAVITEI